MGETMKIVVTITKFEHIMMPFLTELIRHEMATSRLISCQSTSKLNPLDNKMPEILSLDEVNCELGTTG